MSGGLAPKRFGGVDERISWWCTTGICEWRECWDDNDDDGGDDDNNNDDHDDDGDDDV